MSPARHGAGNGPTFANGVLRLLEETRTPGQNNSIAIDTVQAPSEEVVVQCQLRVMQGGDGGCFMLLNAADYGQRGPAPYLANVCEPNLKNSFAVGIDVHNPPNNQPFGPWGNYQNLPQREVSLHWNGREIIKRVAPNEFRDNYAAVQIVVQFAIGGAAVTVQIGEGVVFNRQFIPGMQPYHSRLAIAAATRNDATTLFDVAGLRMGARNPARPRRPALEVEVFNHVLTDNSTTSYQQEVTLPPEDWAFGRVILTLQIHDAGPNWDEWDRCGHLYVIRDGEKYDILPFITSYRTECFWQVDVTHFRPWLTGKTTFEIAAGTTFYKNRGYMMSVSLTFHHGPAQFQAFRVIPLWHGTAHYKSAENHFQDFFTPQQIEVPAETKVAAVWMTTTGHSQVGEFTPSKRTLVVDPDVADESDQPTRFDNTLWKTDCYLNPNRPQFGTWKYSRAGWAPGDVVQPWWQEVSQLVQPGKTVGFRYEPHPYEFPADRTPAQAEINKASHIVRAYLILAKPPTDAVPAPILQVGNVNNDSAAKAAGVKPGDYIVSYNGQRVDSIDDLRSALQAAAQSGKETVTIVVYRGAEQIELQIKPGPMGINLRNG